MADWFDRFFNKNKGMRRIVVVWAMWLITVVILRVTEMEALAKITAPVASVVASVIGILATAIAFYKWSRGKQDDTGNDKG